VLTAQVAELRARYESRDTVDPAEAKIVQERLQQVEADLALALQRQRDLVVRSPVDGRFVIARAADLPGRFVRQGEVLSYVSRVGDSVIRIVVPEDEADLVRNRVRAVGLKFASRVTTSVAAAVKREVPALSDTLPSLALSTLGGGDIAVDPTDPSRVRTLSNLLHLTHGAYGLFFGVHGTRSTLSILHELAPGLAFALVGP
jgi:putative peptide zinc metalloprotease protein